MAFLTSVTTPATGDDSVFEVKTVGLAAGWSVTASGNGLSAYGPAGSEFPDVITTSADLGTAGAWFRFKMPGSTREWLFIRKTDPTLWTVRYSVAGFSGGSPSATVAPTASDQQTVRDGTILGTNGTYRWLCAADNAAPYEMWASGLTIGSLTPVGALALVAMDTGSYGPTDPDPYVVYAFGGEPFTRGPLVGRGEGTPANFSGWFGAGWAQSPFANLFIDAPYGQGQNLIGFGLRSAFGTYEFPAEILCASLGYGVKGRPVCLRWALSTTATAPYGTHLLDGNGNGWVRVGVLWLRWDTSVPSL